MTATMAPRIPTNSRGPWEARDSRTVTPYAWMDEGACFQTPPSTFFPFEGDDAGVEKAKAICATCSHVERCGDYALTNRIDYGIWGGLSEKDRRRIIRQRRKTRAQEEPT